MKICSKCKLEKADTEFHKWYKNPPYQLYPSCKKCRKEQNNNPEAKLKLYLQQIRYKFNITSDRYLQMLKNQNWKCKICFKNFNLDNGDRRPHIDHCHESGKIRGLLCHHCNIGIGMLSHDVNKLKNAIFYLDISG